MYLLVTEPLEWPISAAILTSVYPRSFAILTKLCRNTWGVTSESFDFLKSNCHWFGNQHTDTIGRSYCGYRLSPFFGYGRCLVVSASCSPNSSALAFRCWREVHSSWIQQTTILKPLLISNAIDVPLVIVLFGVLGGLLAFGLIELFLSPLILAVLLSIWREWVSDDGPSSENLRIEGTEACTPVTPKALWL